jgi:flagellar protein FlaG
MVMKIDSMDASNSTRIQDIQVKSQVKLTDIREFPEEKHINMQDEIVSGKVVVAAVEKANRALVPAMRRLDFSVHEATNNVMVKVIDTETNEVIREFPPEKILDMIAKMWEMAGIIVDERR